MCATGTSTISSAKMYFILNRSIRSSSGQSDLHSKCLHPKPFNLHDRESHYHHGYICALSIRMDECGVYIIYIYYWYRAQRMFNTKYFLWQWNFSTKLLLELVSAGTLFILYTTLFNLVSFRFFLPVLSTANPLGTGKTFGIVQIWSNPRH